MSDETPRRRRSVIRPFITRGAIFFVCGVVLTVASALPVLWVREIDGTFNHPSRYGHKYGVQFFVVDDGWGGDLPMTGVILDQPGPWWSRTSEIAGLPIISSYEVAAGVPFPAFSAGGMNYFGVMTS